MPGLIGRKIGMTSVFSADGKNVPCTVIEAGPCVVTQVKTVEKDGYKAVQLGFGEAKEKNTSKPLMGTFKKAGTTPKRHLAEFKFDEPEVFPYHDAIAVASFEELLVAHLADSIPDHGKVHVFMKFYSRIVFPRSVIQVDLGECPVAA